MLGIFETQIVSNLRNRFLQIKNPFPGDIDYFFLNIFLGRFAGLFFDYITKIIRRKVQFSGTPGYRRQPVFIRFIR